MRSKDALLELLETKTAQYQHASFVETDPISIPHRFSGKEDREIAAFLAATISWGTRKGIIKNGFRLMEWMDCSPAEFIRGFSESDLDPFRGFVHRTFNGTDLITFLYALKNIYERHGGMEEVFRRGAAMADEQDNLARDVRRESASARTHGKASPGTDDPGLVPGKKARLSSACGEEESEPGDIARHDGRQQGRGGNSLAGEMTTGRRVKTAIMHFREVFFELPHETRTRKHVSDPGSGSAAKRLNMMLRWLVRRDDAGVDLGIWDALSPADLVCPLDVHSGRVARKLGLLKRKQNDWKAAGMLTQSLRRFDPMDPVKYDFALFGMGVFEGPLRI